VKRSVACATVGLAIAWFVWWLFRVLQTEDLPQGAEWRYDITRINELRRIDVTYRVFQPVIQLLARFNRRAFRDSLPAVQREIQAAGMPRFWLAEEYLIAPPAFKATTDAPAGTGLLALMPTPGGFS
jgi:tight adherence protein C